MGTVLAVAVALGLVAGGQTYFTSLGFRRPMPLDRALAMGLRDWLIWALFLPAIWWAAREYPLERPKLARDGLMHVALAAGFALAYEASVVGSEELFPRLLGFPTRRVGFELTVYERIWWLLSRRFVIDFFIYSALALTGRFRTLSARMQERERTELHLRSSLAEARMQSLKMQLQPHFLFNTLNAISTLIHRDPKAADEMLAELSDLLRSALDAPETHSLAREMEFLNRYLGIQGIRFGDRLKVTREIDPATLEIETPAMILQPIVENALRHGIERKIGPGELRISARKSGAGLELAIWDNGQAAAGEWREGIGLSNTRARLQQHFGTAYRLEIHRNGVGTTVRILLPNAPAAGAKADEVKGSDSG